MKQYVSFEKGINNYAELLLYSFSNLRNLINL
jgi:hypothetical protein